LQQGELSMVCVGLSERDLILGGQWPPWHPPISTPASVSEVMLLFRIIINAKCNHTGWKDLLGYM